MRLIAMPKSIRISHGKFYRNRLTRLRESNFLEHLFYNL